jgi:hypothetical protein
MHIMGISVTPIRAAPAATRISVVDLGVTLSDTIEGALQLGSMAFTDHADREARTGDPLEQGA